MDKQAAIYVAGHRGLAGSAIWRALESKGYRNLIGRTSRELDLRDPVQVEAFFGSQAIEYVFLAAAKVGGIVANNDFCGDFIRDNLMIQTNVIEASRRHGIKKLLFLGSTCIYPKLAPQPLQEDSLLRGDLEPTNEAYAIAKIAGIKMCQAYNRQYGTKFISAMPTNLYGPNDNFDLETSHVLPALLRKIHEAKETGSSEVEIWGTGTPRREFLHSDDLADACIFLMENYEGDDIVNVGVGDDISIRELAEMIASVVGFEGRLAFNSSRPDGTPRKLVDTGRINGLGWRAGTPLPEGIRKVYAAYRQAEPALG
ncbi:MULTISPECIES: GDP-L-fucose synthase [unclassified Paenibacillus]|uniref:GDP-L-fucose synthase family protein n=1 Tax=Paenibacillus TaxID=44249 RepID=UPI00038FF017|nr:MULTISPECIES: GDP-L-fucose synthase [unclassified Paenibacillus]KKC47544.1 GDP-L-fucose synthase [Paenibacillus sp. D9]CDN41229.1 GDP-L-fucose synthase 1 [Paenibacillus sp. P22]